MDNIETMQVLDSLQDLMHVHFGFELGYSHSAFYELLQSVVLAQLHQHVYLILELECLVEFHHMRVI